MTEGPWNKYNKSDKNTSSGPWDKYKETGYFEDIAKSGAANLSRGVTDVIDMPGSIMGMVGTGAEKALTALGASPEFARATRESLTEAMPWGTGDTYSKGVSDLTGGATEYEAKTLPGKVVGEVAYLAPSAALGPGTMAQKLVLGAVAPGITGSLAGAGAEGVARMAGYENPERIGDITKFGTEIFTPAIAGRFLNPYIAEKTVAPSMQYRADEIKKIEDAGFPITAGSYMDDNGQFAKEMYYPKTKSKLEAQPKAFTDFVLNEVGIQPTTSSDRLQDVIENGRNAIGSEYSSITDGIPISPTAMQNSYGTSAFLKGKIDDQISMSQKNGKIFDGSEVAKWRSDVSRDTKSIDAKTRQDAREILEMIDNIIEGSIKDAGRSGDVVRIQDLRNKYRGIIAIEDAAEASRRRGYENVIIPYDMEMAIRNQGKKQMARGQRGDLGEVTRTASRYLPTDISKITPKEPGAISKAIRYGLDAGLGAIGYSIGSQIHPVIGAAATTAGVVFTELARAAAIKGYTGVMGSQVVQEAIKRTAMNPKAAMSFIDSLPYAAPSVIGYENRPERKAGGRVGTSREDAADRLVNAAERAKKEISRGTESLLDTPDDHVAAALAIANRSI